jgi:hypothetical protein
MNSKNLSELSTAELVKKEKELKDIINYSSAVLIITPIVMIGLFIQNQYGAVRLLLILSIFLPIFLIFSNKKQLSDIRAEIEKRTNNQ